MMASAVARKQLWKLGTASVGNKPMFYLAHPNGKRVYIVDAWALEIGSSRHGVHAFVESVLNDSMVNVSGSFKMQKGHHSLVLQHEIHEMRNDIVKRLADSGHEILKSLKEIFADSRHEIGKGDAC